MKLAIKIGYARVSTEDQNLDLQTQALKREGCTQIFFDKGISGDKFTRSGLNDALNILQAGDKFIVWRLDRLGRSLLHLVNLLEELGKRDIRFKSICEHIDTSSSGGRLVFHMMAALAEFERSLISERTRAGMAAAKENGKRVGRMPLMNNQQCFEAKLQIDRGDLPETVAKTYGVSKRTLQRSIKRSRY